MKRWYVVQVYAGYEEAIKKDLTRRIQEEALQDFFGEILIPSVKLKQLFAAEEEQDEQLFPGYMLIEMEMLPETMRCVSANARVFRFLGGKEPVPLSKKEIDRVLAQVRGDVVVAAKKSELVVGGEVTINEGPFDGFVGVVDKIDEENEKVTVMVSIFGRMTPVELSFSQVKQ
jgi:transcription termination/antitermination protein NusG